MSYNSLTDELLFATKKGCVHYHGGEENDCPGEVDLDGPEVGPVVGAALHHADLGQVGEQTPLPSQVCHKISKDVRLTS